MGRVAAGWEAALDKNAHGMICCGVGPAAATIVDKDLSDVADQLIALAAGGIEIMTYRDCRAPDHGGKGARA